MNDSYTPDYWIIVRIYEDLYKIFATWDETETEGVRWKLNSGITQIEETPEEYRFYGYSGSCYICGKYSYGTNMYGIETLAVLQKELVNNAFPDAMTILEEDAAFEYITKTLNTNVNF